MLKNMLRTGSSLDAGTALEERGYHLFGLPPAPVQLLMSRYSPVFVNGAVSVTNMDFL